MPSKKKKYNARFPPARIKKIMQTDEDVGKVAAAVPVIISRALELFIDSLIEKTATVTREKHAKTLSTSHIKKAIHSEKTFDFLRDLVKNVPDHQVEEEDGGLLASGSGTQEPKPKQVKPRKPKEPSDKGPTRPKVKRGPGRPRKVKTEEKKESSSAEEDSEETETDEEEYPYESAESGNQGQFLSPPPGGVENPLSSISPGQAPNAQSALQAPQTSSTVTFPGTSSSQLMQPMFQPPQVQAYPMHNIPIPQYPFPMPMAQCNPPQFIPNPALSGSNNNNHQFMPPMMSPYMAPFMNMHQPGFMMPPHPSQEGPQYMNLSPATFRQPTGAGQGLNVAHQPQINVEVNKQCVQTEDSASDYSDNLPLDMSVSGKSRSHSFTQPQGPVAQPVYISNQNDTSEFVPSRGKLHQMQPRHSVSSNDQNMGKNGPISNMNPMQGSAPHYNSLQKPAVKLPSDLNSASTSGVVNNNSVPNDKEKVFDQKSIQYENLSSLMNKGPAKMDNSEVDEDYDT